MLLNGQQADTGMGWNKGCGTFTLLQDVSALHHATDTLAAIRFGLHGL
jgi:hypothetical protein